MGKSHFYDVKLDQAEMKGTKVIRALFRDTPLSPKQVRESIGPVLSLSAHNAERLRRLRRNRTKQPSGPT